MTEMPALLSFSFDDAGTFATALTKADVTCMQTSKGPIHFDLTICATSRLQLHFSSLPIGSCIAVGKTAEASKCFHVPLGNAPLISMHGRKMDTSTLAVYEEGGEHAICAAGGARLAYVSASKELIHQTAQAHSRPGWDKQVSSTEILSSDPAKMGELRQYLDFISELTKTSPSAISNYAVFRNIEETLISLLLLAADCDSDRSSIVGRVPVSRCRVLRKVDEVLRARACEPLYVTDLCAAVGVSQPTLYRIFFDVLDMNPKRYLQLRRLHLVRERLLHDPNQLRTVSSVAYDCGFWQLGRFGQAYLSLFGEPPSRTLKRGRELYGSDTRAGVRSKA